jgi:hypothetical protein
MTDLLIRIEQNQPVEAQELYDYIVEAIVKQGRPSVGDNDRCLYRGPDGLKCAAGHVIPDSMYSEDMENRALFQLKDQKKIPKSLIRHAGLMSLLQDVHDEPLIRADFLNGFLSRVKIVAEMKNLQPYGGKT